MIIDTHGHLTGPTELYEFLHGFSNVSGGAAQSIRRFPIADDRLEATIAPHLEEITKAGIDFQLIAPPSSAIFSYERRSGLVVSAVQQVNDMIAQAVRLHPDRFAGVGVLPLSSELRPRDCIAEMDRCFIELGFVAFYINPDPCEGLIEYPHMGDEFWYPFYERLVELDVPGIIHGGSARYARMPEQEYILREEAVTVWGILRSPHVFRDFPTLKLVVPHGGAGIPFNVGRAKAFRLGERSRDGDHWEPFETSLRRLYFDTALLERNPVQLLLRLCGVDRCLFGTESPGIGSVVNPATGRNFNDVKGVIDSLDWLSESDRAAIYEGNIRKVFSRLPISASSAIRP